jgi:hypothetical protein
MAMRFFFKKDRYNKIPLRHNKSFHQPFYSEAVIAKIKTNLKPTYDVQIH